MKKNMNKTMMFQSVIVLSTISYLIYINIFNIMFILGALILSCVIKGTLLFIEILSRGKIDIKHFFQIDRIINQILYVFIFFIAIILIINQVNIIAEYNKHSSQIQDAVIKAIAQAVGLVLGAKIILGYTFNEDKKKYTTDTSALLNFYKDEEYIGKELYIDIVKKANIEHKKISYKEIKIITDYNSKISMLMIDKPLSLVFANKPLFINTNNIDFNNDTIKINYDNTKFNIPNDEILNSFDRIMSIHKKSVIYNQWTFRLTSLDLTNDTLNLGIKKTTYYNQLMTNFSCGFKLYENSTIREILEPGTTLSELNDAAMNNHIHINVLGILVDEFDKPKSCIFDNRTLHVAISKGKKGMMVSSSLKYSLVYNANNGTIDANSIYSSIYKEIMQDMYLIDKNKLKLKFNAIGRDFYTAGTPVFYFTCYIKENENDFLSEYNKFQNDLGDGFLTRAEKKVVSFEKREFRESKFIDIIDYNKIKLNGFFAYIKDSKDSNYNNSKLSRRETVALYYHQLVNDSNAFK